MTVTTSSSDTSEFLVKVIIPNLRQSSLSVSLSEICRQLKVVIFLFTGDIPPPQTATIGLHPIARRLLIINWPRSDGTLSWHWYTHNSHEWDSNPWPLDRKSGTVPLSHRIPTSSILCILTTKKVNAGAATRQKHQKKHCNYNNSPSFHL